MPPPRAPPPGIPTPDSTYDCRRGSCRERLSYTLHAQRCQRRDRVVHEIGDDENMHEVLRYSSPRASMCSLCGTWLDR